MKNKMLFAKNSVKIRNVPKSGRKSDPPSGLAADALSRSAFGFAFSNNLFFAFVSLWRVLVYLFIQHPPQCQK